MNGTVLNVYTGELLKGWAVLTKGAWISYVGDDPGDGIGLETKVFDATGKILVPGFIDGHTHLADGLYNPTEFLKYAMTGGTTTIITETIEPFPIAGYEGVVDFLDAFRTVDHTAVMRIFCAFFWGPRRSALPLVDP